MKLELFKTAWGSQGSPAEEAARAIDAGFTGIEAQIPARPEERDHFAGLLDRQGLELIAEVSTCTAPGLYVPLPGNSPVDHLDSLEGAVRRGIAVKPRFFNTMAGHDAWSLEESLAFCTGVLELEQKYGVAISVETHRGRFTYNPWSVREVLRQLPALKITCDFSHWCVVTERLILDEESGLLDLVANHAYHIHGRVGYDQGPQVPDPRAPEYALALAAHERWWDRLWDGMAARGFPAATLTPEFGPDGYLHLAPFTRQPVADLWTINRWIGQRQRDRFRNRSQVKPVDSN